MTRTILLLCFVLMHFTTSWANEEPLYDFCEANAEGQMLYYRYIEPGYCEVVAGPEHYAYSSIVVPPTVLNGQATVIGVGAWAFKDCNDLTEVTLPNTTLYVESAAFISLRNLRRVSLGDNIVAIGQVTFENCRKLEEINIPQSLEYVDYFAFHDCNLLPPLYNDRYFFYYPTRNYDYEGSTYAIPEGIETIGISAFSMCNLGEVIIPNTVTTIMENAFDGCDIRRVEIPTSVTTIQDMAFSQSWLEEVTVPASVTDFGKNVFCASRRLRKGTLLNPLDSIPEGTFGDCFSLESVSFPSTVHKLGIAAFAQTNLSSFDMAGIDELGERVFYNCPLLESITLPEGIRQIPREAFSMCHSLREVHLPSTLEQIGVMAFWQDTALDSLIIPDAVRKVDMCAFEFARPRYIDLGKGIEEIALSAFSQNPNLTAIDLPASLRTIELIAFGYCENLRDVMVHWPTPLALSEVYDAFIDSYQQRTRTTLHVPAGTGEAYAQAEYWKDFYCIVDDAAAIPSHRLTTPSQRHFELKIHDGQPVITDGATQYSVDGIARNCQPGRQNRAF